MILSPLNNTSNEKFKLKVAAYPGRIYYGKIDPNKIDEISLDFYNLYKAQRLPDIEDSAVKYTKRLLKNRFDYYGVSFTDYIDKQEDINEIYYLLFATTFNIPRVLGYILHYCYLDRVSKKRSITKHAIAIASQKYYEDKLSAYFRLNRYALEPYDRKLDRYNQQILLKEIVNQAKDIRKKIITGKLGGSLLKDLSNPPTSHFTIFPELESVLSALELNTLISKYHEMRDKDGKDISVFALYYGLCVKEKLEWGYPKRQRYDKDYFKQRIFSFNTTLHEFLKRTQIIKCTDCGAVFSIDEKDKIEFFDWLCRECKVGKCQVVKLDKDFTHELSHLKEHELLEPIEIEILQTLYSEDKAMRSKEISALLDVTYQLVGKRTDKLQEKGLVDKQYQNHVRVITITDKAKSIYFGDD